MLCIVYEYNNQRIILLKVIFQDFTLGVVIEVIYFNIFFTDFN